MQIPLISGIYGATAADFERSVPINVTPVAEPGDGSGSGVSKGYLRTIAGIETIATTAGKDRGSILYKDQHLRVIGDKLYRVSGVSLVSLGSVGDDGLPVQFAEGADQLGIASNKDLFYFNGTALTQVTDTDLGDVLSVTWADGRYITTDGGYLVVTELSDPMAVDPLKYGSSEADPDPIVGVLSQRGEVYAINRYSIEKFVNSGSTGFPYQRSRGSQISRGAVGSSAYTSFVETFAFCGSARNETPAIYLAGSGQAIRISPRVLDAALSRLSPAELTRTELETINNAGLYQLLVHLPLETWVYHWTASQLLDLPVWSRLASGMRLEKGWPARHYQQVGTEWWCGTDGKLGRLSDELATAFDDPINYQFDTPLLYNEGRGAIVHEVELVVRGKASVAMSYTNDGRTWSQERFCGGKRLAWRRLGKISNYRGFRWRGVKSHLAAFPRLEARLEPLDG